MRMSMSSLHNPNKFLNTEKGDDSTENSEPDGHVMRSVSLTFTSVSMSMSVRVAVTTFVLTTLSHQSVGDQMKEGVTEKTSRSETEQDLEKTFLLFTVVEGDQEKDEEWGSTDE